MIPDDHNLSGPPPSSTSPHNDYTMSSTNFAAAQERVLERRHV